MLIEFSGSDLMVICFLVSASADTCLGTTSNFL